MINCQPLVDAFCNIHYGVSVSLATPANGNVQWDTQFNYVPKSTCQSLNTIYNCTTAACSSQRQSVFVQLFSTQYIPFIADTTISNSIARMMNGTATKGSATSYINQQKNNFVSQGNGIEFAANINGEDFAFNGQQSGVSVPVFWSNSQTTITTKTVTSLVLSFSVTLIFWLFMWVELRFDIESLFVI